VITSAGRPCAWAEKGKLLVINKAAKATFDIARLGFNNLEFIVVLNES
jgi:hypothetical protein